MPEPNYYCKRHIDGNKRDYENPDIGEQSAERRNPLYHERVLNGDEIGKHYQKG
jgi:hypothetical protein